MNKSKFPEPVEALIIVLLTFLGLILLSLTIISFTIDLENLFANGTKLSLILLFSKIPLFIILLYYAVKKEYPVQKLFTIRTVSPQVIIFSIIIGLSLLVLTDEIKRVIDLIVPIPGSMKDALALPKDLSGIEWALLFIGYVFIVPITDESLFRGFLQVSLEEKGDPTRAVLLTSVSWALMHISPYLAIPVFILGIFLGYLAWKTGSIIPSIIIQALFGLLAVIFMIPGLEENFDAWYLMGDHVSPVILVIAAASLFYSIKMIESVESRH